MTWFFWALAAYAGNALVLIVDKSLLGGQKTAVSNPLTYTLYSGALAAGAVVLLPLAWAPLTGFVLWWSLLAAVWHLAALYFFFRALKFGEPSRVAPLVGAVVPLFTLIFAAIMLGEVMSGQQLRAIALLIAGGALLSLQRLSSGAGEVLLMGLAGLFFAAYFVTVKYLYDHTALFLATFAWSRVVEGIIAITIGTLLVGRRGSIYRTQKGRDKSRPYRQAFLFPIIFAANKLLAGGAFLLQNYAISLGSVSVVNALQGTQYAFLFILATIVSIWFPQLFREELDRFALGQKIAGIVLISIGVALVV